MKRVMSLVLAVAIVLTMCFATAGIAPTATSEPSIVLSKTQVAMDVDGSFQLKARVTGVPTYESWIAFFEKATYDTATSTTAKSVFSGHNSGWVYVQNIKKSENLNKSLVVPDNTVVDLSSDALISITVPLKAGQYVAVLFKDDNLSGSTATNAGFEEIAHAEFTLSTYNTAEKAYTKYTTIAEYEAHKADSTQSVAQLWSYGGGTISELFKVTTGNTCAALRIPAWVVNDQRATFTFKLYDYATDVATSVSGYVKLTKTVTFKNGDNFISLGTPLPAGSYVFSLTDNSTNIPNAGGNGVVFLLSKTTTGSKREISGVGTNFVCNDGGTFLNSASTVVVAGAMVNLVDDKKPSDVVNKDFNIVTEPKVTLSSSDVKINKDRSFTLSATVDGATTYQSWLAIYKKADYESFSSSGVWGKHYGWYYLQTKEHKDNLVKELAPDGTVIDLNVKGNYFLSSSNGDILTGDYVVVLFDNDGVAEYANGGAKYDSKIGDHYPIATASVHFTSPYSAGYSTPGYVSGLVNNAGGTDATNASWFWFNGPGTYSQAFTAEKTFNSLTIPAWSAGTATLTMKVFPYYSSIANSLSGTPVFNKTVKFEQRVDNIINMDSTLPAGKYVVSFTGRTGMKNVDPGADFVAFPLGKNTDSAVEMSMSGAQYFIGGIPGGADSNHKNQRVCFVINYFDPTVVGESTPTAIPTPTKTTAPTSTPTSTSAPTSGTKVTKYYAHIDQIVLDSKVLGRAHNAVDGVLENLQRNGSGANESMSVSTTLGLIGWITTPNGISKIQYSVDDGAFKDISYTPSDRADLVTANIPYAAASHATAGFGEKLAINLSDVANGSHKITIRVIDQNGGYFDPFYFPSLGVTGGVAPSPTPTPTTPPPTTPPTPTPTPGVNDPAITLSSNNVNIKDDGSFSLLATVKKVPTYQSWVAIYEKSDYEAAVVSKDWGCGHYGWYYLQAGIKKAADLNKSLVPADGTSIELNTKGTQFISATHSVIGTGDYVVVLFHNDGEAEYASGGAKYDAKIGGHYPVATATVHFTSAYSVEKGSSGANSTLSSENGQFWFVSKNAKYAQVFSVTKPLQSISLDAWAKNGSSASNTMKINLYAYSGSLAASRAKTPVFSKDVLIKEQANNVIEMGSLFPSGKYVIEFIASDTIMKDGSHYVVLPLGTGIDSGVEYAMTGTPGVDFDGNIPGIAPYAEKRVSFRLNCYDPTVNGGTNPTPFPEQETASPTSTATSTASPTGIVYDDQVPIEAANVNVWSNYNNFHSYVYSDITTDTEWFTGVYHYAYRAKYSEKAGGYAVTMKAAAGASKTEIKEPLGPDEIVINFYPHNSYASQQSLIDVGTVLFPIGFSVNDTGTGLQGAYLGIKNGMDIGDIGGESARPSPTPVQQIADYHVHIDFVDVVENLQSSKLNQQDSVGKPLTYKDKYVADKLIHINGWMLTKNKVFKYTYSVDGGKFQAVDSANISARNDLQTPLAADPYISSYTTANLDVIIKTDTIPEGMHTIIVRCQDKYANTFDFLVLPNVQTKGVAEPTETDFVPTETPTNTATSTETTAPATEPPENKENGDASTVGFVAIIAFVSFAAVTLKRRKETY